MYYPYRVLISGYECVIKKIAADCSNILVIFDQLVEQQGKYSVDNLQSNTSKPDASYS